MTPQSLAHEIIDLVDRGPDDLDFSVDSFGMVRIRIKDRVLEDYMNGIVKSGEFGMYTLPSFENIQGRTKTNGASVIMPITGLCSGISLTQFRRWSVMEWVARTYETMLGYNKI